MIFFGCASLLRADTVYLKNGRSIEGLIKSQDINGLELEVCSGVVTFRNIEIEKIKKSDPQEILMIRKKWEQEKLKNFENLTVQQQKAEQESKKIEFTPDSQNIIVGVTLNKKVEVKLVLDTGATTVVLKKSIAKDLGVNLDNIKSEAKVTVADGRNTKAKVIVLDSVKTQGVEARNVKAVILADEESPGIGDGLLGMSFLKKFNFKVDRKNKKLILEKLE